MATEIGTKGIRILREISSFKKSIQSMFSTYCDLLREESKKASQMDAFLLCFLNYEEEFIRP